jgi:hypothetical protein
MPDDEHFLHRQVHPSWMQDGMCTSQAFQPTPKDNECLSVYNGALIDAQGAFEHYTRTLNQSSVGTLAVSVLEVSEVGLQWRPDTQAFAEHAVVDFSAVASKGAKKAKAQALAGKAKKRGWMYKPTNS